MKVVAHRHCSHLTKADTAQQVTWDGKVLGQLVDTSLSVNRNFYARLGGNALKYEIHRGRVSEAK